MRNEDYVSYEVAKLLYGNGYEGCSDKSYLTERYLCHRAHELYDTDLLIKEECPQSKMIAAPTLWDANKWLVKNSGGNWFYVFPVYDEPYEIMDYRVRVGDYFDLRDGKKGKLLPLWFADYYQAFDRGLYESLKTM